jgi:hypothetical protein
MHTMADTGPARMVPGGRENSSIAKAFDGKQALYKGALCGRC